MRVSPTHYWRRLLAALQKAEAKEPREMHRLKLRIAAQEVERELYFRTLPLPKEAQHE